MMFTSLQQWVIVGIMTFNYGCNNRSLPSVHTRVAAYLDWIQSMNVTGSVTGNLTAADFIRSTTTATVTSRPSDGCALHSHFQPLTLPALSVVIVLFFFDLWYNHHFCPQKIHFRKDNQQIIDRSSNALSIDIKSATLVPRSVVIHFARWFKMLFPFTEHDGLSSFVVFRLEFFQLRMRFHWLLIDDVRSQDIFRSGLYFRSFVQNLM